MKRTRLGRGKPMVRGPRKKPPTAAARARKRARKAAEFVRKYGSLDRVLAIKALLCHACHAEPAENAHTECGGTGRKAGWETIVDLGPNCHTLGPQSLHRLGSVEEFDRIHGTDLRARAAFLAEFLKAEPLTLEELGADPAQADPRADLA